MQDERDIVVFTDDEGNDFELEVMDYFFYNGQEYAVLSDAEDAECGCEECAHDEDVYKRQPTKCANGQSAKDSSCEMLAIIPLSLIHI